MTFLRWHRAAALTIVLCAGIDRAYAIDVEAANQLGAEDGDAKVAAIRKLVADGDGAAVQLLTALQNEALVTFKGRLLIVDGSGAKDALSGEPVNAPAAGRQAIVVNNRIRTALDGAVAAFTLADVDPAERLAAARVVADDPTDAMLPLVKTALDKETDSDIKRLLAQARALIEIKSVDAAVRRGAVKLLGASDNPNAKEIIGKLMEQNSDGSFAEADAGVRAEAAKALRAIERRSLLPQIAATLFSGLSLGSVLLLAALGLAITFGLMGIINMAHGEMLMLGAYTTYIAQSLFRAYLPDWLDWYIVAAVPMAFAVAALVGIALERTVIRFLYGRPLETLLTTWGISLMLIQSVRSLFGAQNVEVANPAWMSGGFSLGADVVLPYNRVVIILFAAFVVFLVWLFLTRTRLGLYVRAVTQNRTMADCMGIPTPRVDWLTFGLGSGIAGLGGVALSQIGNVGPDLGQSYIVDSFMVVVLGGVGQLAGTIIAAVGLGEINKFLEPFTGAVLGKIFVLIIIILFIQKRPQGLFALKGRMAES
ncbi:MAG: urea ABC transporter permease subunit UrtB [Candidatus Binatia bacterium]